MTTHLMTDTLPAIVGAGVVSRTTETMFDKGKNRRRTMKRRLATKSPSKLMSKRKPLHRKPVAARRAVRSSSSPGKGWVQLSRAEMVRLMGVRFADALKANAGHAVKHGMYDKFIYYGGKYYIGTM